jgi:hypothetical protein
MTDWLLIYFDSISSQCAPKDLKRTFDELFAVFRLLGDEFHGCLLHRCHGGGGEFRRQTAQCATGCQFA